MAKRQVVPATCFRNEAHELTPTEKHGGRLPQYVGISWAAKGIRINQSLRSVSTKMEQSRDPLKADRYFVLALPVTEVEKPSTDKRRAPQGTYKEPTEFGGDHGRVFDRLGLDLLQVTGTGTDFSGRHWFRGKAARHSIRNIAKDFYSVQAVHSPLFSIAAGEKREKRVLLQDLDNFIFGNDCVVVVAAGNS